MKKLIILISLTLCSCTKDKCVDFLIENKSNSDVEIISFEGAVNSRNIKILSLKTFSELSKCDWGGWYIRYDYIDSIQIKVNNNIKKTYYPSDTEKSIFKTEDRTSWKLVENKNNYSKFVFEITNQDLQ